MAKKLVEYNGTHVIEGWPEKIVAAQRLTTYVIGGAVHPRVAFGDEEEDWGANCGPCHDCAVKKGQLHVPGCDGERCPACGGQAISCDCDYEDDDLLARI
jgi:hypothetical protein